MSEDRLPLIENMLKKNPTDSFLNYAAALEYRKLEMFDKAISALEHLLSFDTQYLGAYYQLGKLYEEAGKPEAAIVTYKKGKEVAKQQNDQKTIGELTEALMFLDEDAENW